MPVQNSLIPPPNYVQRGTMHAVLHDATPQSFTAVVPAGANNYLVRCVPNWGTNTSVTISRQESRDGGVTFGPVSSTTWDADVQLPTATDWLSDGVIGVHQSVDVTVLCTVQLVKGNNADCNVELVSD